MPRCLLHAASLAYLHSWRGSLAAHKGVDLGHLINHPELEGGGKFAVWVVTLVTSGSLVQAQMFAQQLTLGDTVRVLGLRVSAQEEWQYEAFRGLNARPLQFLFCQSCPHLLLVVRLQGSLKALLHKVFPY